MVKNPSNHPGHRVYAYPATETNPTLWVLGSSDYGAQLAAHLGLNYAFAHFITDGAGTKEALDLCRKNFKPNGENQKPFSIVCVWALAKRKKKPGRNLKAECVGEWTAIWGFLVLCCLLKCFKNHAA